MHLLHPSSLQPQARCYSSSTDDAKKRYLEYFQQSADKDPGSVARDQEPVGAPVTTDPPSLKTAPESEDVSGRINPNETETPPASSSSNTPHSPPVFGFQSLSSLVPRPRAEPTPSEDFTLAREAQPVGKQPLQPGKENWALGRNEDGLPESKSREDIESMPEGDKPQRWVMRKPGEQSPVPLSLPETSALPEKKEERRKGWGLGAQEERPVGESSMLPMYARDRGLTRKRYKTDEPEQDTNKNIRTKSAPTGRGVRRRPNPFEDESSPSSSSSSSSYAVVGQDRDVRGKVLLENQDSGPQFSVLVS
jgi:hypothetical protein